VTSLERFATQKQGEGAVTVKSERARVRMDGKKSTPIGTHGGGKKEISCEKYLSTYQRSRQKS